MKIALLSVAILFAGCSSNERSAGPDEPTEPGAVGATRWELRKGVSSSVPLAEPSCSPADRAVMNERLLCHSAIEEQANAELPYPPGCSTPGVDVSRACTAAFQAYFDRELQN